jgi:hypothetical protein
MRGISDGDYFMAMQSRWLFVLLGQDRTGKTHFQKNVIKILAGREYERLQCNLEFPIVHPYMIRKCRNISIGNRSLQEREKDYLSVENYFENHFTPADICVISSHLKKSEIETIIIQGRRRFYNCCGVFFTNSIADDPNTNSEISELNWDERWVAVNDTTDEKQWPQQLQDAAQAFVQMLIERARGW